MTKGNWREVRAHDRARWFAQQINKLHWPYYDLINGKLYDDEGYALSSSNGVHAPRFADAAAAEEWLKANDLRGNVR
jgi:hypothetical protein